VQCLIFYQPSDRCFDSVPPIARENTKLESNTTKFCTNRQCYGQEHSYHTVRYLINWICHSWKSSCRISIDQSQKISWSYRCCGSRRQESDACFVCPSRASQKSKLPLKGKAQLIIRILSQTTEVETPLAVTKMRTSPLIEAAAEKGKIVILAVFSTTPRNVAIARFLILVTDTSLKSSGRVLNPFIRKRRKGEARRCGRLGKKGAIIKSC
jgi:hypothetical protein